MATSAVPLQVLVPKEVPTAIKVSAAERDQTISDFLRLRLSQTEHLDRPG